MLKNKNPRPRKNKKASGPAVEGAPTALPTETFSVKPVQAKVVAAPAAEPAPVAVAEPVSIPFLEEMDLIAQVGFAAGKIWQALQDGPLSLTQLENRIAEPRTILLMAIGWLAREEKLGIVPRNQQFELSLKEHVIQHV